jgi:transposase
MAKVRCFVGLDVHVSGVAAAVLDAQSGELRRRRLRADPEAVLDFLAGLPGPLRAVYEAGPSGYVLYRRAAERGLDLVVCAPALTPRTPGRRRKNDAVDAERLARLLMSGDLGLVCVPSPERERLRDLVRAREDLRQDLARARSRLRALLLRRGLRYPGPGRSGTLAHRAWLARLQFDDLASQATLDDYRAAIAGLEQRRTVLEGALGELAGAGPFAETVRRLRAFRGIDTLSAVGLVAEVGDFSRFRRPAQLADYLGAGAGRAQLGRAPAPWRHHQGRAAQRPSPRGRGRLALSPPPGRGRGPCRPPGRGRPAGGGDRRPGPAAPARARAAHEPAGRPAPRGRDRRLRARAVGLSLGGGRALAPRTHRPRRCRGPRSPQPARSVATCDRPARVTLGSRPPGRSRPYQDGRPATHLRS